MGPGSLLKTCSTEIGDDMDTLHRNHNDGEIVITADDDDDDDDRDNRGSDNDSHHDAHDHDGNGDVNNKHEDFDQIANMFLNLKLSNTPKGKGAGKHTDLHSGYGGIAGAIAGAGVADDTLSVQSGATTTSAMGRVKQMASDYTKRVHDMEVVCHYYWFLYL